MRRRLVVLALCAPLLVTACSRPDTTPVSHGTAPVAASLPAPGGEADAAAREAAAEVTYLAECLADELTKRPVSYTLSCADGNETLDALVWEDWGRATARATGVIVTNACDPDCATGALRRDPVRVVAGDLVEGEASRHYTSLTLTYTGDRPPGTLPTESYPVPS